MALKYILKYPKRAAAMIISIALSTFLMVTIGSLAESSINTEINDIKKSTGAQHVRYDRLNMNQVNQIKKNKNIKVVSNMAGYAIWNYEDRIPIYISSVDENMLYMNNTKMEEGKFPTESNEIAIENWVLDRMELKIKVGEAIKIPLEKGGEKEFKLVGIVKDIPATKSRGETGAYVAFNKENLSGNDDYIYSFVEFKEGLKLKKEINDLSKEIGVKEKRNIRINPMLLDAMGQYGALEWDLIKMSLMLMAVGGMVIYSIYSISVLKRVKEYGIMRAIGSTSKQIIYVMLSEIGIIYAIGVLIGILMGVTSVQLFKGITTNLFTEANTKIDIVVISTFAIKLSMIVSFSSILLAGIRAVLLTIKVSPIDAINKSTQDKNIIFNEKKGIIQRSLSITGKISCKNLKRNKKMILFTIVSMSIGCILFIAQSFQNELIRREGIYVNKLHAIYDLRLDIDDKVAIKKGYTKEQINDIKKLPQVKNIYSSQLLYSRIKIDKKYMNGEYGQSYIKYMTDGDYKYRNELVKHGDNFSFESDDKKEKIMRNTLMSLSNDDIERLNKKLGESKIDLSEMNDKPLAILYVPEINKKGSMNKEDGELKPAFNINVGDKVKVSIPKEGYEKNMNNIEIISRYEKYKSQYVDKEFTVVGTVDYHGLPNNHRGTLSEGIHMFISENMFKELSGIDNYRVVKIDMKDNATKSEYETLRKKVQEMSKLFPMTHFEDHVEIRKESEKSNRQYNLLQNSIAIVLMLISGLSIFNNINYNLISRIREHGIMKAIGLTDRQFRKMIRFEGLMYGVISAFASCIIAFVIQVGVYLYYTQYMYKDIFILKRFFIEWDLYLVVVLINLSIGYIATLGPSRQVNKIETTEAIRSIE